MHRGPAFGRQHDQVPGFMQQRMHRGVGAGMHVVADDPSLGFAPVAAGDRGAVFDAVQLQAEAGEQGRGIGEGDVTYKQDAALFSLPFKGVRAACLSGIAARADRTPGALRRAGRVGWGWCSLRSQGRSTNTIPLQPPP